MGTFGLVHGAQHGRWCWDLLAPYLERDGHDVVAMDLPAADPAAGLDDNATTVARALGGAENPIVLVGHSLAGSFLPLAASRCGASSMVFLCAVIPVVGRSLADLRAVEPEMITMPRSAVEVDQNGRTLSTPAAAREFYYPDCDEVLASWAIERLRPQTHRLAWEPLPPGSWPDIPSAYVLCDEDRCISPEWSRRASRERLGVIPTELPGGHSPFLSRPADLAGVLLVSAATMGAG